MKRVVVDIKVAVVHCGALYLLFVHVDTNITSYLPSPCPLKRVMATTKTMGGNLRMLCDHYGNACFSWFSKLLRSKVKKFLYNLAKGCDEMV